MNFLASYFRQGAPDPVSRHRVNPPHAEPNAPGSSRTETEKARNPEKTIPVQQRRRYPNAPGSTASATSRTASSDTSQASSDQSSKSDFGSQILEKNGISIAVMGVTGAGKSTFIRHCIPTLSQEKIGHELKSCTKEIEPYLFNYKGKTVALIDTPGFDDSGRSDVEVLKQIAMWLKEAGNARIKLTGIVYLHRITEPRMTGSAVRSLRMFKALVGDDAMGNVILGTTNWDVGEPEVSERHERELRDKPEYWNPMIRRGSSTMRLWNNRASALALLDHYIPNEYNSESPEDPPKSAKMASKPAKPGKLSKMPLKPVKVRLQKEMMNSVPLSETEAGKELQSELDRDGRMLQKKLAETIAESKLAADDADHDLVKALEDERKNLEARIRRLEAEKQKLREGLKGYEDSKKQSRIKHFWIQFKTAATGFDPEADLRKRQLQTEKEIVDLKERVHGIEQKLVRISSG